MSKRKKQPLFSRDHAQVGRTKCALPMAIRKATPDDSNELTEVSFGSKRHWNYPDHYFDIWNTELTITPEYIQKNHVFIIEDSGIRGFYSVINLQTKTTLSEFTMLPGTWLDPLLSKIGFNRK